MTSLLQKISALPPHQQLKLIQLIAKGLQEKGKQKMVYQQMEKEAEIVFPKGVYLVDKTDVTV